MIVDQEVVSKIAKLANLRLTTDEAKYYESQLQKILTYVGQLSEIKEALAENSETFAESSYWERADVSRDSLPPEAATANAPRHTGTSFQVPRIID